MYLMCIAKLSYALYNPPGEESWAKSERVGQCWAHLSHSGVSGRMKKLCIATHLANVNIIIRLVEHS